MKRYAYGFGFETPRQRVLNLKHGWDDEDSALIIIRAESADVAYAWGREIAEVCVRRLFERAGDEQYSWKALDFADSVEEASSDLVAPEVELGEMPHPDWLAGA